MQPSEICLLNGYYVDKSKLVAAILDDDTTDHMDLLGESVEGVLSAVPGSNQTDFYLSILTHLMKPQLLSKFCYG